MFGDCDQGQTSFKDAISEQQLSVLTAIKQLLVNDCGLKVIKKGQECKNGAFSLL